MVTTTTGFELDEQSVIGSVLLNNKIEDLDVDDFVIERHQRIWRAIKYLSEHDEPIDMVTVATRLNDVGDLGHGVTPEYLAEVQNIVPTGTHAEKYASVVKNKSVRRKINYILTAPRGDESNEQIIGDISRELQDLSKTSQNKSIIELVNEYEELKKIGNTGLLTGFNWLDTKTGGINKGMFWILAAKSFVGKTTFVLQAIRNICNETGDRAVIYTLEQSALNVVKTLERVQKHKGFSLEQLTMTNMGVVDNLRSWDEISLDAQKRKADLIVVDYAQMVDIKGDGIYQKMENLAFAIRGFCNKTGIPVILVSQISEEMRKANYAFDSAKGGGALFQACDIFINLRGNEKEEMEQRESEHIRDSLKKEFTRELIIAKNKYGDIGYKQVQFNYALGYGTYNDF